MPSAPLTVLHVAPHPDDEALGAPATLLGLRAAGHRVIAYFASLGRPDQHARRRDELAQACQRGGFQAMVQDPPLALSAGDDLVAAQSRLTEHVAMLVHELSADLVIAPSPHDGHHAHEVAGRAVRDALAVPGLARLWLWGLWGELALPTLYVGFGEDRLAEANHVLAAHAGELERNDYGDWLAARAVVARVGGAERVFGTGAGRRAHPYAETLCELEFAEGRWWAGAPREPDLAAPLALVPRDRPASAWVDAPSFASRLAAER